MASVRAREGAEFTVEGIWREGGRERERERIDEMMNCCKPEKEHKAFAQ